MLDIIQHVVAVVYTFCHDHCGLEVLQKGDINFKNCAAFSGDNCHSCPNRCNTNFHYHSTMQMRTVNYTDYVDDTQTNWVDSINQTKLDIKKQLEENTKTIQNNIKKKEVELKKMQNQIDSDLRQICYLHRNIHTICMCPINDFTQEYLEKQIEAVERNTNLTTEQVQKYKKKL